MVADSKIITSIFACSDIGNERTNNEDNFIISDLITGRICTAPQQIKHALVDNRLLLAVSDGMGGAQAGEIASALAVYGLRLELLKNAGKAETFTQLIQALEKINSLIWQGGQQNPEYRGMGAAITAVIVEGARAYIAEVGDSRAYLIRNDRIKQITTDQSLFEALVQSGAIKRLDDDDPPSRNIILQSLGGQDRVRVAVTALNLQAGDSLLLCSDGLSNKLTNDEIRKFVIKATNLEAACNAMIGVAKKRGGEDNITMVLAKFEGSGLAANPAENSITGSMEVIASFNPMTGEVERKRNYSTQQMVSGLPDKNNERPHFQSTIGLVPASEYPYRDTALAESDRSLDLLQQAGNQLNSVISQIQNLEDWIIQQGRLDPSLQKAMVHLEHAIKNLQKIETVARKARNLIDHVSNKPGSRE